MNNNINISRDFVFLGGGGGAKLAKDRSDFRRVVRLSTIWKAIRPFFRLMRKHKFIWMMFEGLHGGMNNRGRVSWRRTVNLSETSSLLSCSCSATLLAYSTLQLNPVFYSNLSSCLQLSGLQSFSGLYSPPKDTLPSNLHFLAFPSHFYFLSTFLSPSRTLHMVYRKPLPR